jgi:hypothetical protein
MAENLNDHERLVAYVRDAKAKGADDAAITLILRETGWSERKVSAALAAFKRDELGVAVPARGGRTESPRIALFYVLNFALLSTWAVALLWLAYIVIDHQFADALNPDNVWTAADFRSNVAGQLASLIIAFPLFLWVNAVIGREIDSRPETYDSGLRKWFTFIALIITAISLVGDATLFLAIFLGGGLTAAFFFKSLVLLIVCGGIFAYYVSTIRAERPSAAFNRAFAGGASLLVLIALVVGFGGIGSPAQARVAAADAKRVEDLQAIAGAVHAQTTTKAPVSLTEVTLGDDVQRDPITHVPYQYERLGAGSYRLCATFSLDNRSDDHPPLHWRHGSGAWCYTIDVATGRPLR